VVETVAAVAELFRTYWPTSARRWLPAPAAGELVRNPTLAATYRRLVTEGEAAGTDRERQLDAALRAWYEGFVAEAIDDFCRTEVIDDSLRPHTGLLTGVDLAGWRATYEPTVSLDAFGWQVHKVGPWSQGPVLLQQLAMLEALGDLPGAVTAAEIHRVVEVAKLAFADRDANYGDGADIAALLDPAYALERAQLVGPEAGAALRNGAGRLPTYVLEGGTAPLGLGIGEPTLGGGSSGPGLGEQQPPSYRRGEPVVGRWGTTRGDTCHIDVADRWGNVISATPSGGWLQSSPTIESLGFCLGTRAQMFWLEEGLPNTIAPGKRPRTTLSPSFATRDGVQLSFGTPGGDQQDQWQLTFFLNHAVHGMNLQAAIDSPAWHTTAFASSFYPRETGTQLLIESRAGDAIDELRRLGHDVAVVEPWSLGRMSAISRDLETGLLRAAANPRGQQGYAVGR
jgi:gamma-glutamyltranspeptidase/glutathione hydrolase